MKKRLTDQEIDEILRAHLGEEKRAKMSERVRRTYAELRVAMDEHKAELEAKRATVKNLRDELEVKRQALADEADWPAEAEPLVLAAVALLEGNAGIENTIEAVNKMAAAPVRPFTVRFALHRLVSRGYVSEDKRSFTITPEGRRALEQAKETSKRWIDALENRVAE